jgi:hypothetical protein
MGNRVAEKNGSSKEIVHMGMGLSLTLSLRLMCKVCQLQIDTEDHKDAIFFLGNETHRINLEKWLRLRIRAQNGEKYDPLIICPACGEDRIDQRDRNYRRRAWRYIRKYLPENKIV